MKDFDDSGCTGIELSDGLEGERLECIAGENSDGFAESDVTCGFAAAQIVVVECGEIVVDQRIGVDHLDGSAEVWCSWWKLMGDAAQRPPCRGWGAGACRRRRWSAAWRGEWSEVQWWARAGGARVHRRRARRRLQDRKNVGGHASGLIVRERRRAIARMRRAAREMRSPVSSSQERCQRRSMTEAAGGQLDCEEAVIALEVFGDKRAVAKDLPAGVVAQVEDESVGMGQREIEMMWRHAADGVGDRRRVVVVDDGRGGIGDGVGRKASGAGVVASRQGRPSAGRRCRRRWVCIHRWARRRDVWRRVAHGGRRIEGFAGLAEGVYLARGHRGDENDCDARGDDSYGFVYGVRRSARAMVSARTTPRMESMRQGNCRKSSSGR